MELKHPLKKIVEDQKNGIAAGIYSICSANEYVIEAAMEKAKHDDCEVLIEATANQVNQFGGYTGMTPQDFKEFVFSIADKLQFPKHRIILGGDHLGPLTWKNEKSESAMIKAKALVKLYVLAGFTKIHIDTSMHLDDDKADIKLETKVIAKRGAILCASVEEAYDELKRLNPNAIHPVYIIGSEVPIPGGSQDEEEDLQVTKKEDFKETYHEFRKAFSKEKLSKAWEDVIAIVVQPGVEFGDESVHEYNRAEAKDLCSALKEYPNIVFEGHSTDYQNSASLKKMVEDGIAILKVGPALTFAFREAIFALSSIENELFAHSENEQISKFVDILDAAMIKNPANWNKHYHGSEEKIRLARKYSFSDRCRYYLPNIDVSTALTKLISNLSKVEIPLTLLSQYMPIQYTKIRNGVLENKPEALIKDRIMNLLDDYSFAVNPKKDS